MRYHDNKAVGHHKHTPTHRQWWQHRFLFYRNQKWLEWRLYPQKHDFHSSDIIVTNVHFTMIFTTLTTSVATKTTVKRTSFAMWISTNLHSKMTIGLYNFFPSLHFAENQVFSLDLLFFPEEIKDSWSQRKEIFKTLTKLDHCWTNVEWLFQTDKNWFETQTSYMLWSWLRS